ncbi:hypothetical protein BaRGS_00017738 [Batillaria attramentaria]|uniref:Odorant receptor n=1 Tax=Batillaria attramentaria TaxID=370345 RepID=A0ABD0KUY5_9CAEN
MAFCRQLNTLFFPMSIMGFSFKPDALTPPSVNQTSDDDTSEDGCDVDELDDVTGTSFSDSHEHTETFRKTSGVTTESPAPGIESAVVQIPDDLQAGTECRRATVTSTARKVYCIFVCCLLWFRALSYFPAFWVGVDFNPGMTADRVVECIWLMQGALNVTITLYACFNKDELATVIEQWSRLCYKVVSEKRKQRQQVNTFVHDETTVDIGGIRKRKQVRPVTQAVNGTMDLRVVEDGHCRNQTHNVTSNLNQTNSASGSGDSGNSAYRLGERETTAKNRTVTKHCTSSETNVSERNTSTIAGKKPKGNATDVEEDKINTDIEKKIKIYAVLAWSLIVVNVVFVLVFVFENFLPSDVGLKIVVAFVGPFGMSLPAKILLSVFFVFNSCARILPTAFCCGFCAMLRAHFGHLTEEISARLTKCKKNFPKEMERWRQQHLRLCQCVSLLDRTMSKMLMTSYVTNLPLCIFLLYVMVRGDQELVAMLTYGFWFVSSLGNILVLSGQAALVHEAAHSPVDNLFDVRADLANSRQLAQLQLFISRLTGTSIGFTALGIVTITKEMLLTLGGLLLTYFIVLLQFQI